jgi:hypothetical protein
MKLDQFAHDTAPWYRQHATGDKVCGRPIAGSFRFGRGEASRPAAVGGRKIDPPCLPRPAATESPERRQSPSSPSPIDVESTSTSPLLSNFAATHLLIPLSSTIVGGLDPDPLTTPASERDHHEISHHGCRRRCLPPRRGALPALRRDDW